MLIRFKVPLWLQPGLTSPQQVNLRFCTPRLIRAALLAAPLPISACSTYLNPFPNEGQEIERPSNKVPQVDLTNAAWQKFSPDQPAGNPLRIAVVARDEKIGLTRVVIKAPPNFKLPAHWFAVDGNYTVLKGTFAFDAIDAKGKPSKLTHQPGDFVTIPANYILRPTSQGPGEALLYVTVYGDWAPKLPGGVWGKSVAEPAIAQADPPPQRPVSQPSTPPASQAIPKPASKPKPKRPAKQALRREPEPPPATPLLRGSN
jgi:hypothetical protein